MGAVWRPHFGAANSSNFGLNLALSARGPQTSTQSGKLGTTTSASACRNDQLERNVHREGPRTRSPNCSDFSTPHLESRKLATFANMCTRHCKASEAAPCGGSRPSEAFRGLPRPPEASVMGFRGLSRHSRGLGKIPNYACRFRSFHSWIVARRVRASWLRPLSWKHM